MLFLSVFRLYEVVETHGRVYLVTEWIQGGELYNRITEKGPLTELYAARLFKQLLLAVQHMVSTCLVEFSYYICNLHRNKKKKRRKKYGMKQKREVTKETNILYFRNSYFTKTRFHN